MLWHWPSSWGHELPCFVMAPQVGMIDCNTWAWPPHLERVQYHGSAWSFGLGCSATIGWCGTSNWAYAWSIHSNALVRPQALVSWTHTLRCGPSNWGSGLPHLGATPQVWVTNFHALTSPIYLGLWTPCFGVAPSVGVVDSHPLHMPLELG